MRRAPARGAAAPEVAVIGNVGIDTNIYLPGREIDFGVEANFTENIDYLGQAGGFASRGYARLGKKVAFLGYVGDDALGRFIRDTFGREGIGMDALFVDPAGTSRSVNFMYPDGRRKNFYDGKGHMALRPDPALCRAAMAGARLAHFNIPNWARELLPVARELGLVIACDIQDVVDLEDPYRADFIREADILFFSAANHRSPDPLIRRLLKRKPGQVVVSGMGRKGCAVGAAGTIMHFGPVPHGAPVVDSNGAGDGLAVGFLTSYVLEGRPLEESILRGQIAARHTCTLRAETDHLITAEELEQAARGYC